MKLFNLFLSLLRGGVERGGGQGREGREGRVGRVGVGLILCSAVQCSGAMMDEWDTHTPHISGVASNRLVLRY